MKPPNRLQMVCFCFIAMHALRGYSQEGPTMMDSSAIAGLLEHVEDLRTATLPCIANLTFSGRDARLDEYVLFFRTTPCETNNDTATADGQPCTFSEMAYYSRDSAITIVRFDTVYQEGGHAGPADYFPFSKRGRDYFVVLYKWPVRHVAVAGAFYQARVYRIEPGAPVRVWKNDWLFEEEYDGYSEGRTSRAKYKSRRAIERKLRSADVEALPRRGKFSD